ncbi:uncharacterized protein LAJ45_07945 [Morchella importuna]|uniref:uncharacterized protein n=1 Tax=Morchella importuna TaxID=1174673 RepID=UPI001E8DD019|nr:uncharacterized protein LAJ45_07945 [Morchella importuna]KAH8147845.1 hypothetical protein LAJ45_07945 [Morchella importuna]
MILVNGFLQFARQYLSTSIVHVLQHCMQLHSYLPRSAFVFWTGAVLVPFIHSLLSPTNLTVTPLSSSRPRSSVPAMDVPLFSAMLNLLIRQPLSMAKALSTLYSAITQSRWRNSG